MSIEAILSNLGYFRWEHYFPSIDKKEMRYHRDGFEITEKMIKQLENEIREDEQAQKIPIWKIEIKKCPIVIE